MGFIASCAANRTARSIARLGSKFKHRNALQDVLQALLEDIAERAVEMQAIADPAVGGDAQAQARKAEVLEGCPASPAWEAFRFRAGRSSALPHPAKARR